MRKFEATIWEKAEHWTFEVTIGAETEAQARRLLAIDYPAKSFTIRNVQSRGFAS